MAKWARPKTELATPPPEVPVELEYDEGHVPAYWWAENVAVVLSKALGYLKEYEPDVDWEGWARRGIYQRVEGVEE